MMRLVQVLIAVAALLGLAGCDAIVDIFQAGMLMGVVLVVAVIGLIVWAVSKFRR